MPIINFDTELTKELIEILKEEGINKEDFLVREIPELVATASDREALLRIGNIRSTWKEDELNKGKLKVELSFFLPKGAYATMLIKKMEAYIC